MAASDKRRLSAAERDDLVAYLDGELPEERARALADTLTHSISGRREVDALESTWEMLDLLPRPEVGEDFTERTLTVAVEEGVFEERFVGAARVTARRLVGLLACAAALAVGLLVGWLATARLWPDRTARLARDLTIAERLDDYRAAGDLEFLRALDRSTLLNEAAE